MAAKGQRFELDLAADNFTFNPVQDGENSTPFSDAVKEIRERESDGIPSVPKMKTTTKGFPEHRKRSQFSAFKQKKQAQRQSARPDLISEPSDQAILHQIARKHGVSLESAKEKAEISAENNQRINNMSLEDIEQARSELMSQMNPELLERFLKRANIEEDQPGGWVEQNPIKVQNQSDEKPLQDQEPEKHEEQMELPQSTRHANVNESQFAAGVHFPQPPRDPSKFVPLDPNSPEFLSQLKTHYFPDLPHDPSSLSWLQDPTEEDVQNSTYNPDATGIAPSAIRFAFNGSLITPSRSLDIPTSQGLHHHGDAPSSAGYTIPELALLCRSTLPNQRCIAYQVLGRILFRLGRGDFGLRGSEVQEKLWDVIERERPLEIIMTEANRDGGHVSAKAYATEALWLWRKGGGGDRGILKKGETRAK